MVTKESLLTQLRQGRGETDTDCHIGQVAERASVGIQWTTKVWTVVIDTNQWPANLDVDKFYRVMFDVADLLDELVDSNRYDRCPIGGCPKDAPTWCRWCAGQVVRLPPAAVRKFLGSVTREIDGAPHRAEDDSGAKQKVLFPIGRDA